MRTFLLGMVIANAIVVTTLPVRNVYIIIFIILDNFQNYTNLINPFANSTIFRKYLPNFTGS